MLRNPHKNFGVLPAMPGVNFTLMIGLFLLFLVVPLVTSFVGFLQGDSFTSAEGFTNGTRLGILVMMIFAASASQVKLKTIYKIYKRVRYVKKELLPYLSYEYRIELDPTTTNALAIIGDEPLRIRHLGQQEDLRFMGWDYVEQAASGEPLDEPLKDSVYLVIQLPNRSRKELPARSKEDKDLNVFNLVEEPLSLEEIEDGIKTMISNIIHELPPGESSLKCISPDNTEIEGVEGDFVIHTEIDGSVNYSLPKFNSLVEATLFNVRMTGTSMIVSVVQAQSDKTYICAQIIKDGGYIEIAPDDLRNIINDEEVENFVFVKSVKEMR